MSSYFSFRFRGRNGYVKTINLISSLSNYLRMSSMQGRIHPFRDLITTWAKNNFTRFDTDRDFMRRFNYALQAVNYGDTNYERDEDNGIDWYELAQLIVRDAHIGGYV